MHMQVLMPVFGMVEIFCFGLTYVKNRSIGLLLVKFAISKITIKAKNL